MRALLSSGYLGTAYILRPHAFELDKFFKGKQALTGAPKKGYYWEEVTQFLKQRGADEDFARLKEVLRQEHNVKSRVSRFLEVLQDVGTSSFVAIELAADSWQGRLVRFCREDVLRFDRMGPDIRKLLRDSDYLKKISRLISDRRYDSPPYTKLEKKPVSFNDFRDAAALVSLNRVIKNYERGKTDVIAIFYTETDALRSAIADNSELQEYLAYDDAHTYSETYNENRYPSDRVLLRDATYFLVRVYFGALGFSPLNRISAKSFASMEELKKISRMLSSAHETVSPGEELSIEDQNDLMNLWVRDRRLANHFEEFQSLSFLNSVWSQYKPPGSLEKFIEDLVEIWDFSRKRTTEEELQSRVADQFDNIADSLEADVDGIRRWHGDLRVLLDLSNALMEDKKKGRKKFGPPKTPTLLRDLGMVRWGFSENHISQAVFERLFDGICADSYDERLYQASDISSALDGVNQIGDCIALCGVLWALGWHSRIGEFLRMTRNRIDEKFSLRLMLLEVGADILSKKLSPEEKEQRVGEIRSRVDGLCVDEKKELLVGLGFVMYHAWFSDYDGLSGSMVSGAKQSEWISRAEDCIGLGERAVELLDPGTLLWAFAVNQSFFIGVLTQVRPKLTKRLGDLLVAMVTDINLWNYRFADTLGYYHFLTAKRILNDIETRGGEMGELDKGRVGRELRLAHEMYLKVTEWYGDREIDKHKTELDKLSTEVDLVFEGNKGPSGESERKIARPKMETHVP